MQHPDVVHRITHTHAHVPESSLFPTVLWARLYAEIEWGLTEHTIDQTSVLSFYHRQVRSAIERRYLTGDANVARHRDLAQYFSRRSGQTPYLVNTVERSFAVINERMVSELAFQQSKGQLWVELKDTIFDAEFLQARIQAGKTSSAIEDIAYLAGDADADLTLLSNVIDLSRHILDETPEELPNQMMGRAGKDLLHHLHHWPSWATPHLRLNSQTLNQAGGDLRRIWPHDGSVVACTFSPNGRYALSASYENTVRLWDVATGESRHIFKGHTRSVKACCFSPDGRYALSASDDHTMRLWDVQTGESRHTFQGHTWYVNACAFSPDGRFVLSASHDKTLRLWDVATGESRHTFKGHTGDVDACAFSPDGRFILSASNDPHGSGYTLRLWDVQTGESCHSFNGHTARVTDCKFSPDGQYVLSASYSTLQLWDVQTGESRHSFKGHTGKVRACAFSPDGQYALSASEDHTLRLWDVQTGESRHTFKGHTGEVRACAFSPDGQYALSASGEYYGNDNTLRLWEVSSGQLVHTFAGHTEFVDACCFSPDGR
jgi:WD40 repeat protein